MTHPPGSDQTLYAGTFSCLSVEWRLCFSLSHLWLSLSGVHTNQSWSIEAGPQTCKWNPLRRIGLSREGEGEPMPRTSTHEACWQNLRRRGRSIGAAARQRYASADAGSGANARRRSRKRPYRTNTYPSNRSRRGRRADRFCSPGAIEFQGWPDRWAARGCSNPIV